jgi:hypothetical protein
MKLSITICCLFFFILITGFAPPKDWLMLKQGNYSIQYPMGWQTDKSGLLGTKFILFTPKDSGGLRSYISLSLQAENDSVSVDSMIAQNKLYLPNSIADYQFVAEEKLIVNGRDVFRLIYSGTQNGRKVRWMQQGCWYKHNYYALTFTASEKNYTKWSTLAKQILETFKFY